MYHRDLPPSTSDQDGPTRHGKAELADFHAEVDRRHRAVGLAARPAEACSPFWNEPYTTDPGHGGDTTPPSAALPCPIPSPTSKATLC